MEGKGRNLERAGRGGGSGKMGTKEKREGRGGEEEGEGRGGNVFALK